MANIPFVDDLIVTDIIGTPSTSALFSGIGAGVTINPGTWRNFKSVDWYFRFGFRAAPPTDISKIIINFKMHDDLGNSIGCYNFENSSILNVNSPDPVDWFPPNIVSVHSHYVDHDGGMPPKTAPQGSMIIDVSHINSALSSGDPGASGISFVLSVPVIGNSMEVDVKYNLRPSGAIDPADTVYVGYLRRAHREWIKG